MVLSVLKGSGDGISSSSSSSSSDNTIYDDDTEEVDLDNLSALFEHQEQQINPSFASSSSSSSSATTATTASTTTSPASSYPKKSVPKHVKAMMDDGVPITQWVIILISVFAFFIYQFRRHSITNNKDKINNHQSINNKKNKNNIKSANKKKNQKKKKKSRGGTATNKAVTTTKTKTFAVHNHNNSRSTSSASTIVPVVEASILHDNLRSLSTDNDNDNNNDDGLMISNNNTINSNNNHDDDNNSNNKVKQVAFSLPDAVTIDNESCSTVTSSTSPPLPPQDSSVGAGSGSISSSQQEVVETIVAKDLFRNETNHDDFLQQQLNHEERKSEEKNQSTQKNESGNNIENNNVDENLNGKENLNDRERKQKQEKNTVNENSNENSNSNNDKKAIIIDNFSDKGNNNTNNNIIQVNSTRHTTASIRKGKKKSERKTKIDSPEKENSNGDNKSIIRNDSDKKRNNKNANSNNINRKNIIQSNNTLENSIANNIQTEIQNSNDFLYLLNKRHSIIKNPFAVRERCKNLAWGDVNMSTSTTKQPSNNDDNNNIISILQGGEIPANKVTVIMDPYARGDYDESSFFHILSGQLQSNKHVDINIKAEIKLLSKNPRLLKNIKRINHQNSSSSSLHIGLTPREVFHYAVQFKCKSRTINEYYNHQVDTIVNNALEILELTACADTIIIDRKNGTRDGGGGGITNGERIRVHLGVEIIAKKKGQLFIFLDDPLLYQLEDKRDATKLFKILQKLAHKKVGGASIILSIKSNDPPILSDELFNYLDHLVLLNRGGLMYQGPALDIFSFFDIFGYHSPSTNISTKTDWIRNVIETISVEELKKQGFFPNLEMNSSLASTGPSASSSSFSNNNSSKNKKMAKQKVHKKDWETVSKRTKFQAEVE